MWCTQLQGVVSNAPHRLVVIRLSDLDRLRAGNHAAIPRIVPLPRRDPHFPRRIHEPSSGVAVALRRAAAFPAPPVHAHRASRHAPCRWITQPPVRLCIRRARPLRTERIHWSHQNVIQEDILISQNGPKSVPNSVQNEQAKNQYKWHLRVGRRLWMLRPVKVSTGYRRKRGERRTVTRRDQRRC